MELYLHFPLRLNGVQSDNLSLLHTIFVRDDTKRPYVQTYSPVFFNVLLTVPLDREKNQRDTQLILSIFRQPLHVSGVSRPIIRRYNRMYTTIGTYYSF
jgi:hypothetical protein